MPGNARGLVAGLPMPERPAVTARKAFLSPWTGCDRKGEGCGVRTRSDKLKWRKKGRKEVSQSGLALFLSGRELVRLSSWLFEQFEYFCAFFTSVCLFVSFVPEGRKEGVYHLLNESWPRLERGGRCRLGSLALRVGQLPVIHTPWVALSVVSSVAPTSSTVQKKKNTDRA